MAARDSRERTGTPSPPSHAAAPSASVRDVWCELCSEPATADDFNDAAGMVICPRCIEDMLDASTVNTRTAVGLVGRGDSRP